MALNLAINFNKRDLEKHKVLLIGIAMAVLCAWYGYNKIYKSAIGQVHKTRGAISDENLKTEVIGRLERLQNELAGRKGLFPKENDISWLTEKVSNMARESGLEVNSLNSNPVSQLSDFNYGRVNISVSGSFDELGEFVARVESSREFMKIESLSLKKNKKLLDADIAVATYFWKVGS